MKILTLLPCELVIIKDVFHIKILMSHFFGLFRKNHINVPCAANPSPHQVISNLIHTCTLEHGLSSATFATGALVNKPTWKIICSYIQVCTENIQNSKTKQIFNKLLSFFMWQTFFLWHLSEKICPQLQSKSPFENPRSWVPNFSRISGLVQKGLGSLGNKSAYIPCKWFPGVPRRTHWWGHWRGPWRRF